MVQFETVAREYVAGPTYNAATATVVDNIPPGTLFLTTIAGLPNVGCAASYKLFVILTSGHEAGSNTVTVTRPAP